MNLSDNIHVGSLHHAYALVGEKKSLSEKLLAFVRDHLKFATQANPDFWMSEQNIFTIDDARALTELHIRKPLAGDRKIFVLVADGFTVEAQNALLKLFEEPITGNHFFVILSEDKTILPTLRSRMMFILAEDQDSHSDVVGSKFLDLSLAERLELVAEIVEKKDKEEAKLLVRSIIDAIHAEDKFSPVLDDLLKAEDYLSDRSPSIKMLLEHIAHVAP